MCACVHTYIYIYICIYIYIYVYTCIYTHTYIHMISTCYYSIIMPVLIGLYTLRRWSVTWCYIRRLARDIQRTTCNTSPPQGVQTKYTTNHWPVTGYRYCICAGFAARNLHPSWRITWHPLRCCRACVQTLEACQTRQEQDLQISNSEFIQVPGTSKA